MVFGTISVLDHGAGTGPDDTAAIQSAIDSAKTRGGIVYFPPGTYTVSSTLILDLTSLAEGETGLRVNLIGAGDGSTEILSSHNETCFSYLGNAGTGILAYLSIQGIRFSGPGDTGIGIKLDNAAYCRISDCTVVNFETGIYGTDVLSSTIDSTIIRFNRFGYQFYRENFSNPNAINLQGVIVGANRSYGGHVNGAACFTIVGGTIEGNGGDSGGTGYGLKLENCGAEGAVGLAMYGVYCEGNVGMADIWIDQQANNVVHTISGCSFVRFTSDNFCTNNILFGRAVSGTSMLNLSGNGFKSLETYPPDASRRFWVAPKAAVADLGNMYGDQPGLPDRASRAPTETATYSWSSPPNLDARHVGSIAVLTGTASGTVLAWWDGGTWLKVSDNAVIT